MFLQRRKRTVDEYDRPNRGQIARRAKRHGVVHPNRRAVYPIPFGAVERQFFPVEGEEVLAEELAKPGKQIPEAPNNGIVAPDRILFLADVDYEQNNNRQYKNPYGEYE